MFNNLQQNWKKLEIKSLGQCRHCKTDWSGQEINKSHRGGGISYLRVD